MSTGYEDSFYVMVDGAPKMMTLDDLVEAYEGGSINRSTLVVEVGGSDWRPLSDVADLGDEEEEAEQAAPAPALPVQAPAAQVMPAIGSRLPPMPGRAPATMVPASVPPVSAPISRAPLSTAPVVQDLDFGLDDEMAFRKSRSKAPIFAALAVALLGGGAFAVTKTGTEAPPLPPVVAAPAPVAAPTVASIANAPEAKPAEPSSDADKPAANDGRLTDAMKEALLARDKQRETTKKTSGARVRSGGGSRSKNSSSSSSDGVFRAGGSADDPLNSKL